VHLRTEDRPAIERAGAVGFFTKGTDTQRLIDRLLAIRAAMPALEPRQACLTLEFSALARSTLTLALVPAGAWEPNTAWHIRVAVFVTY
jgi:hypothetical protein